MIWPVIERSRVVMASPWEVGVATPVASGMVCRRDGAGNFTNNAQHRGQRETCGRPRRVAPTTRLVTRLGLLVPLSCPCNHGCIRAPPGSRVAATCPRAGIELFHRKGVRPAATETRVRSGSQKPPACPPEAPGGFSAGGFCS
jgi:hypothetical protein